MTFRKLPKVSLQTLVPEEVAESVGIRAVRERKPDNEVVTELLCIGLGLDPSRFGIEPSTRSPANTPSSN